MALPYARKATTLEVQGILVSKPYVAMTLAVMKSFGVTIRHDGFHRFDVRPGRYLGRVFAIEPDASAASNFFALAAITGGEVSIHGLGTSSVQGDVAFVDVLELMGCTVVRAPESFQVKGAPLRGIDVDMNGLSDTIMTLGVVALFAEGRTRIRNVAHVRHKESDRIAAMAAELRKLGASVREFPDGLAIDPPAPDALHGASIATYDDHRMAMAFAIAGLRIAGVTILDPGCVAKTYPGFWADLQSVRSSRSTSAS
jgi:3-phosphoshikimate 1-carboxyvinyltransferase